MLFDWAKNQSLAYAFDDDPVGLWYEASLPGREAFCMRVLITVGPGNYFTVEVPE